MDLLVKILMLFEFGCAIAVRYYPGHPDNYYNPKLEITSHKQKNRGPLFYRPFHFAGPSGDPLFLTPLIEAGKIAQARTQSLVTGIPGFTVSSHSGYITVNKETNSNLFFWFILAEEDAAKAPVVLWLQGGPGASSLYGMFTENGPFSVNSDLKFVPRPYAWSKPFNMLYIDQPVGTGFSFTDKDAGYARNETDVARDLLNFLLQFFTLFPDLSRNEFFVTGESYAGKYVPSIAHAIVKAASPLINLKGIAIGNGLTDPQSMLPEYAPQLYSVGLLDENEFETFAEASERAVSRIDAGDYVGAFKIFDTLLNGDLCQCRTLFQNASGCTNYFNYLVCVGDDLDAFAHLFQNPQVRKAMHVGDQPFHTDNTVEEHMTNDIMQSVKPEIRELLNGNQIDVMFYNGALDVICSLTAEEAVLDNMDWDLRDAYEKASKKIWRVQSDDKEVAGYVHHVRNLYQVAVRDAGHMVPADQPRVAFDMITRFVFHKGFDK